MSELFKYFREYDTNSQDSNYSFLQEGGDYVMYKGGNVQMRVSVDKKKRATTYLEDLNQQIKINKRKQVMLLYDVLYEQFNIEEMDFEDDDLNEEQEGEQKAEEDEQKTETNNSANKYNRNSILQLQQELSEELKYLEKERNAVYKEIEENERKKSILRRDILSDINLHNENIKITEDEEERTKSYKEVIQNYNKLFELNDVGIMEIVDKPKLKLKNNNNGNKNRNRNNSGENNINNNGPTNENEGNDGDGDGDEDNDSVVNLNDVQVLDEETVTRFASAVSNKTKNNNNKNNNNNSMSSFASARSSSYKSDDESDDESKEAEFDLE